MMQRRHSGFEGAKTAFRAPGDHPGCKASRSSPF